MIPDIRDLPEIVVKEAHPNAILMDEKGFIKFIRVNTDEKIPHKISIPLKFSGFQNDKTYGRVPVFEEIQFTFWQNIKGWLVYR